MSCLGTALVAGSELNTNSPPSSFVVSDCNSSLRLPFIHRRYRHEHHQIIYYLLFEFEQPLAEQTFVYPKTKISRQMDFAPSQIPLCKYEAQGRGKGQGSKPGRSLSVLFFFPAIFSDSAPRPRLCVSPSVPVRRAACLSCRVKKKAVVDRIVDQSAP